MTKQSLSEVEVFITLDEHHASQFTEIAEQLAAKGLKDIQILGNIGTIAGKCERNLLKKLQTLTGVESLEVSGTMKIAPPDSEIQ